MPKEVPVEEAVEARLERILDDVADAVLQLSQENLEAHGTTDTGFLAGSGDVESPDKLAREVIYRAPYSLYVEFGTPPHPVSRRGVERLENWGKRKLGVEGLGERIAWKIRRQGTEPQPFLRPAMEEVRARLGEIIGRY